jgi:peptidoglycan/LPS O-acetylase OafA/YrhL
MIYMFSIQVLVTVGLSSLTYLMIEKPMIRFGSALISARQSRSRLSLDVQPAGKSTG